MRTRHSWLLALLVAGCGQFRNAPPPVVVAPEAPIAPRPQAVRAAKPRHLACIQHPRIDVWENRLRSHESMRVATRGTLRRARPYLPRVRRIFIKAGLPSSLALLPVIESEFYRTAQGQLDDRGLWQFRVATAQRFGLVVNERRDQRLHPYRASRAAARYLRALHRRYGDWPLALAAYNAGESRVDRARARRPGASFWQLAEDGQLPSTTAEYVPRFLALIRVVDGEGACTGPTGGTPEKPITTQAAVKPRPQAKTKTTAAVRAPAPDAGSLGCQSARAPRPGTGPAESGRFAGL